MRPFLFAAVALTALLVVFGWSASDAESRPWLRQPCQEATCMPWTPAPTWPAPYPTDVAR